MTIYDIAIDFTTGNSFNTERNSEERVGIVTTDLGLAKENLRRIKKHYEKHAADSNWCDAKYALTLLTDEGDRVISPFWIGYFETLHGAKIIEEEDVTMSFKL